LLMAVIANDGVEGLLRLLLIGGPIPLGRLSECATLCPFIELCRRSTWGLLLASVSSRLVATAAVLPLGPLVVTGRGRGRNCFSMPCKLWYWSGR